MCIVCPILTNQFSTFTHFSWIDVLVPQELRIPPCAVFFRSEHEFSKVEEFIFNTAEEYGVALRYVVNIASFLWFYCLFAVSGFMRVVMSRTLDYV